MAKCADRFLKSAKLREKLKYKIAKMRFLLFTTDQDHWTRYPKTIWPKTAHNSPYFLPFLLGQKTSRSRSLSVIMFCFFTFIYHQFFPSSCPERKYLNPGFEPGFESVVKSYLARQTKSFASPRCCKVMYNVTNAFELFVIKKGLVKWSL